MCVMLKTAAKIFLIFVLLVSVAAVTGFVTYNLTKGIAEDDGETVVRQVSAEAVPEEDMVAVPVDDIGEEPPESEYYVVRLEGTTLGIYVAADGKEEFLYHADVYKNNLSADDLKLLQDGVRLMNISELTGFIENFTS